MFHSFTSFIFSYCDKNCVKFMFNLKRFIQEELTITLPRVKDADK